MSTLVTAREFNRDVSAAKRAAHFGPVTITDRARPAYVLLTIEDFRRMSDQRSIVDILQADDEIAFEPVRLPDEPRAASL
ncbi:MAG: type II toxin-antitoxin system prevent-host-death family antitoxin [Micrococcales bacterium]|nr:type II toxin-antitoxin system prevent-host-death family antitoxin [Micrococcales bacterium]